MKDKRIELVIIILFLVQVWDLKREMSWVKLREDLCGFEKI